MILENKADLEYMGASAGAIADAASVTDWLTFAKQPEISVDPSCGDITLDWFDAEKRQMFGLIFFGKGEVTGVFSPACEDHPIWSKKITDVDGILEATNRVILTTVR